MDKLIKTSRIGYGFIKAVKLIAWICSGLMIFTACAIFITKDTTGLLFRTSGFSVYSPVEMTKYSVEEAMATLSSFSVALIFGGFVLLHLEKILAEMKEGKTPFSMDNVRRIRKMAIIMFVGYIVQNVVGVTLEVILHTDIVEEFFFGDLFVAALIYVISFIFEYGVALQNQVDETL